MAFSEPRHGGAGTREFLASVIHDPQFSLTVNDIVVEFGNARYQSVADRYISGQPVTRDELRQIWENTTAATGVWTAPTYEGVLDDIRALNASLPPGRRVRVLLGDPPIDWSLVRGPADEDMNDRRDATLRGSCRRRSWRKDDVPSSGWEGLTSVDGCCFQRA